MPTNPCPLVDGRYELAERIGAGGYSEVWLAHDQVLGRPVAVKLLHEAYACHQESLERFRAEARHAGSISHQNIARIYDFGDPAPDRPAQLPYLVMEYVDGPSLAELLRAGRPLDAAACLDVVAQTAAGLQAAHAAGLVHRDIKPANLLLSDPGAGHSEPGLVKITDFGISHAVGSAPVTSTGVIIGTPGYLAPERAAGAQATYLSDLYSLGVVAYECLAGGPPFGGTPFEVALAHLERPFPALPESVPGEVTTLVGQLVAKDPAERPASAEVVAARAAELRDWLSGAAEGAATMAGFALPEVAGPGALAGSRAGSAADVTRALAPDRRSYSTGNRRAWRVAAGTIAMLGVLALAVTSIAAGLTGGGQPAHHVAPAATNINVDAATMVGQPVRLVVRELRREGLRVRVRWRFTQRQRPGIVLRVRPGGERPARSVVTVIGAAIPGLRGGDNGDHHGDGHDGPGKGDGPGHGEGHGSGPGQGDGGPGRGGPGQGSSVQGGPRHGGPGQGGPGRGDPGRARPASSLFSRNTITR